MTITHVGNATFAESTDTTSLFTSTTITAPTRQSGDLCLAFVGNKPITTDPGNDADFTRLASSTGGSGTNGGGTGPTRITVWSRTATNAAADSPTVTWSAAYQPAARGMVVLRKTGGGAWDLDTCTAVDTDSSGTNYYVVGVDTLPLQTGDWVVAAFMTNDDGGGTTATTAHELHVPGCVLTGQSARYNNLALSGNDGTLVVVTAEVQSGSAVGPPTIYAETPSGDSGGAAVFVRVAEAAEDAFSPIDLGGGFELLGISQIVTDDETANASAVVDRPPNVVEDSFLIAKVGFASAGVQTWTPPSGWTQLGTLRDGNGEHSSQTWYKVAGGSEPADYTWTCNDNVNHKHIVITAFGGVDPADPIDDDGEDPDGSTGGITLSVTTTDTGKLLWAGLCQELHAVLWDDVNDDMDTRYAEYQHDNDDLISIGIFTELATTATTYNREFDHVPAGDTSNGSGHLVALNPAEAATPISQAIGVAEEVDGAAGPLFYSIPIDAGVEVAEAQVLTLVQGGGEQTEVIAPAAEADEAQTVAVALNFTAAIAPALESDEAQAVAAATTFAAAITPALEADEAITTSIAMGVTVAAEVDEAQTITTTAGAIEQAITPAAEADEAQVVPAALSFAQALSVATDEEHAQAITAALAFSAVIDTAIEWDTPGQTLSYTIPVVAAVEADEAQTITEAAGGFSQAITLAAEEDEAQPLGIVLSIAAAFEEDHAAGNLEYSIELVAADEADEAQLLGITLGIAPAPEADEARTITEAAGGVAIEVTPALEHDAAQALTASLGGVNVQVDPAQEEDAAQPVGAHSAFSAPITAAEEGDEAQGFTVLGGSSQTLTPAVEVDHAQTLLLHADIPIDTAVEAEQAQALTVVIVFRATLGQALEVNEARSFTPIQDTPQAIAPALEGDEAQAFSIVLGLRPASEHDTARTASLVMGELGRPLGIDPLPITVDRGVRRITLGATNGFVVTSDIGDFTVDDNELVVAVE